MRAASADSKISSSDAQVCVKRFPADLCAAHKYSCSVLCSAGTTSVSRITDERELVSPMRVLQCVLVLPLLVACSSSDVGTPGGRSSAGRSSDGRSSAGSSSTGSSDSAGRTGAAYAGQSGEAGAPNVGV